MQLAILEFYMLRFVPNARRFYSAQTKVWFAMMHWVKCKKVLFTDKVNLKSLSQAAPAMKFRFLYFSCIFVGSCQHIDIIKIVHDLNSLLLSDEGPMLATLDYTIRIGSTPTILYFDLYLYSAYAAHYVYSLLCCVSMIVWKGTISIIAWLYIITVQFGNINTHDWI